MKAKVSENAKKQIKKAASIAGVTIVGGGLIFFGYKCGWAVGVYSASNAIYKILQENGCQEAIDIVSKAAKAMPAK